MDPRPEALQTAEATIGHQLHQALRQLQARHRLQCMAVGLVELLLLPTIIVIANKHHQVADWCLLALTIQHIMTTCAIIKILLYIKYQFFMAALCNRAGHIYFHPMVSSFFLFFLA